MNYIIDPRVFYWMEVLDNVKGLGIIMAILLGVATICATVWYYVVRIDLISYNGELDEGDKEQLKTIKKIVFLCFSLFAVSLLIAVFVPFKQTMMEMLIARYATYENAEWTVESLKSIVDYIVEAFKSVR